MNPFPLKFTQAENGGEPAEQMCYYDKCATSNWLVFISCGNLMLFLWECGAFPFFAVLCIHTWCMVNGVQCMCVRSIVWMNVFFVLVFKHQLNDLSIEWIVEAFSLYIQSMVRWFFFQKPKEMKIRNSFQWKIIIPFAN